MAWAAETTTWARNSRRTPARARFSRRPGSLLRIQQIFQLGHELADVAEVTIYRREPDVGDFIKSPQFVHHKSADFAGAHLALGLLLQRGLDAVGDRLERGDAHRPLLAGLQQPGQQLLPLEALAAAVLLDDHVRDL